MTLIPGLALFQFNSLSNKCLLNYHSSFLSLYFQVLLTHLYWFRSSRLRFSLRLLGLSRFSCFVKVTRCRGNASLSPPCPTIAPLRLVSFALGAALISCRSGMSSVHMSLGWLGLALCFPILGQSRHCFQGQIYSSFSNHRKSIHALWSCRMKIPFNRG